MTGQLILKILLAGTMIATIGALTIGLFNMSKEGKELGERSNKMMRLRILFQAFAIVIFSILLLLKMKSPEKKPQIFSCSFIKTVQQNSSKGR